MSEKEIESVFDVKKPSLKDKLFGKSVNPNNYIHKFQNIRTLLVFGAVAAVALYVVSEGRSDRLAREEAQAAQEQANGKGNVVKRFDAASVKQTPEEYWMSREAARISALYDGQEAIMKKLDQMAQNNGKSDPNNDKLSGELSRLSQSLDEVNKKIVEIESKTSAPATISLTPLDGMPKSDATTKPNNGVVITNRFIGGAGVPVEGGASVGGDTYPSITPVQPKPAIAIQTVKKEEVQPTAEQVKEEEKKAAEKAKRIKTSDNYVPSGSTVRTVLLSGIDAPAGPQAEKLPIVMMLDDLTQLPNRAQFNAKECRLIGAGHGDLSSERAFIRLETLSCVDEHDVVHEMRVKGYVFGEDGKPGVRGRLVSKQGQLLANALLAGIGSGMGQIMSRQSMTYSQTALGQSVGVDPDSIVQGGIGIGASRAMEKLAQYYIKMAEKIFPIIEVDAGRVVDVVFTGGVDFLEENNGAGAGNLMGLIDPKASNTPAPQQMNQQQMNAQQMMMQQMLMGGQNMMNGSMMEPTY